MPSPNANENAMKNEAVRAVGRLIESKEAEIDAARLSGEDTTAMEADLAQLRVEMTEAQAGKKVTQEAARDARKEEQQAAKDARKESRGKPE